MFTCFLARENWNKINLHSHLHLSLFQVLVILNMSKKLIGLHTKNPVWSLTFFTPNSDAISLYNITPESNTKVRRIKEMITN